MSQITVVLAHLQQASTHHADYRAHLQTASSTSNIITLVINLTLALLDHNAYRDDLALAQIEEKDIEQQLRDIIGYPYDFTGVNPQLLLAAFKAIDLVQINRVEIVDIILENGYDFLYEGIRGDIIGILNGFLPQNATSSPDYQGVGSDLLAVAVIALRASTCAVGDLICINALAEVAAIPAILDWSREYYISQLADDYGIQLTGATSALLADIHIIWMAVITTAANLKTAIDGWGDPNTGFLRGIANVSSYLNQLRNAATPAAALKAVVADGSLLSIPVSPTHYAPDSMKLFGYLSGWEYAKFARRVIQIDRDIYSATFNGAVANRLWTARNWLPTATTLLRTDWSSISGYSNRGITSIDPVQSLTTNSPYDLIIEYRNRTTVCANPNTLCHENCYVQSVKDQTDDVTDWDWAGSPRTSNYLPFLPKSILTGCVPARRSLAQGIITLWDEIGIYQDYEEVTRLVNLLEHGAALNSPEARQALFQFLHNIYHTTQPPQGVSYEVEYVAAMSSIIFDFDNVSSVDIRTYNFLMNMLTPVAELTNEASNASAYATEPLGVAWEQHDFNLYTTEVQNIISQGANRTFGSTEFNNLLPGSQTQLIDNKQNGTGDGGWVEFYPLNSTITADGINGAPSGVFLMTPAQFNFAQALI